MLDLLLAVVGVLAGSVAAVSGFGIGSGALGGLVGNQGGIRTAAMLGYAVPKESFVATATAIALFVDAARLPVYLVSQGREISRIAPQVLIATVAVIVGTLLGRRILVRMSQTVFRRLIAFLLLGLGVYMLVGSWELGAGSWELGVRS